MKKSAAQLSVKTMITFFLGEIDGYTRERVFSIKLGIIFLASLAAGVALGWLGHTVEYVQEFMSITSSI